MPAGTLPPVVSNVRFANYLLVGPVIHRVAAFRGSVLCQDEDQVRGFGYDVRFRWPNRQLAGATCTKEEAARTTHGLRTRKLWSDMGISSLVIFLLRWGSGGARGRWEY